MRFTVYLCIFWRFNNLRRQFSNIMCYSEHLLARWMVKYRCEWLNTL
jgi:hypothetical protein